MSTQFRCVQGFCGTVKLMQQFKKGKMTVVGLSLQYICQKITAKLQSIFISLPRKLCNARHLSVCLLATLCKNYWTDLHKNVTTDVSVHKEELIKFWKSSASGSGSRNVLKILQHCEIGHFSTIWLISPFYQHNATSPTNWDSVHITSNYPLGLPHSLIVTLLRRCSSRTLVAHRHIHSFTDLLYYL